MGTLSDVTGAEFRTENLQVTTDCTARTREVEKDESQGEREADVEEEEEEDSGPKEPERDLSKQILILTVEYPSPPVTLRDPSLHVPLIKEVHETPNKNTYPSVLLCFVFRHSREDQGPDDRRT
ncbi:hypothetical protein NDU88_006905 [Pleurodeles waltl]|uniref:Uncharacterized protein n=1 Tax=Pleurodeles waltl TaxID=8319 RepID=A0AAV7MDK0_PLEWA|nr:hypothetical protein NDU88_006905 [Pleurodeles waltl]